MLIRTGYNIAYECSADVPMLLMVHVRPERQPDLRTPEVLNVTLPRVGALLPFLMLVLILVFRPRGLMGTRDT